MRVMINGYSPSSVLFWSSPCALVALLLALIPFISRSEDLRLEEYIDWLIIFVLEPRKASESVLVIG